MHMCMKVILPLNIHTHQAVSNHIMSVLRWLDPRDRTLGLHLNLSPFDSGKTNGSVLPLLHMITHWSVIPGNLGIPLSSNSKPGA